MSELAKSSCARNLRHSPRWYVVQVERGRENTMARALSRVIPAGVLEEPVFLPKYETQTKVAGTWFRTEKALLQGYLIAVSADSEGLEKAVSRTVEFARVLRTDDGPSPLSREEVELMGGLGRPGFRVVPVSRAFKSKDGKVTIIDGPLKGRESLIKSINRHKSTAYLEVDVCGQKVAARSGVIVLPAPETFSASGSLAAEPTHLPLRLVAGIAHPNPAPSSIAVEG